MLVDIEPAGQKPRWLSTTVRLGKRDEHELEQLHLLPPAVEPQLVARPLELGEQRRSRNQPAGRDRGIAELEQPEPLEGATPVFAGTRRVEPAGSLDADAAKRPG